MKLPRNAEQQKQSFGAASVTVQQCKLLRTKISLSRCERNFKYQVGSRQNNERKQGWKKVHRVNF